MSISLCLLITFEINCTLWAVWRILHTFCLIEIRLLVYKLHFSHSLVVNMAMLILFFTLDWQMTIIMNSFELKELFILFYTCIHLIVMLRMSWAITCKWHFLHTKYSVWFIWLQLYIYIAVSSFEYWLTTSLLQFAFWLIHALLPILFKAMSNTMLQVSLMCYFEVIFMHCVEDKSRISCCFLLSSSLWLLSVSKIMTLCEEFSAYSINSDCQNENL